MRTLKNSKQKEDDQNTKKDDQNTKNEVTKICNEPGINCTYSSQSNFDCVRNVIGYPSQCQIYCGRIENCTVGLESRISHCQCRTRNGNCMCIGAYLPMHFVSHSENMALIK